MATTHTFNTAVSIANGVLPIDTITIVVSIPIVIIPTIPTCRVNNALVIK